MEYSLGTLCGVGGCLLLIAGLVSPLYTIQFMGMISYPVTAMSEPVIILGFAALLAAAAWSVSVKRHPITIAAGVLIIVVTLLTSVVLEQQIAEIVTLIGTFDSSSLPFGGIVSSLTGMVNATAVVPSWGWYVLIASGLVLIIAGICGMIQKGRGCFADDLFE